MEKPSKIKLRKAFLEKRNALTPVARARDSAIIRQRIFRHRDWQDMHTVLIYVSFRTEVDTHKLIQEALRQGKRVVVPVVEPQNKEIILSELKLMADLAPGPFQGIFEPPLPLRKLVMPLEIELAIIPGAAFDRRGARIGLGGGFFDKLLVQMPTARKIGVGFSVQLSRTALPMQAHDIRMTTVITEKEVIAVEKESAA